jgi:hypothetical protein
LHRPQCGSSRPVEYALDVPVKRSHNGNPRKHRWPVLFSHQEQRLPRGLPFRRLLFGFGQLGDLGPGVFERDALATARQRSGKFHQAVSIHQAISICAKPM